MPTASNVYSTKILCASASFSRTSVASLFLWGKLELNQLFYEVNYEQIIVLFSGIRKESDNTTKAFMDLVRRGVIPGSPKKRFFRSSIRTAAKRRTIVEYQTAARQTDSNFS